ncbi:hypothetical protein PV10_07567 [Exophiala mesophila]|uniref:NADH-ubiquinone oxidoreductase 17.8 kDa subunit, mitochondrial n=1 Tax=Exophiala mesophila TaxID=212818 RepID=A0A0D1ZTV0_EXOME|nr:uncharacterized protein PV10_07567 [Exophiala mesophila]KIV90238.1 hypothetical protein PV10_07567 [Exophiala mesophila]
MSSVSRGARAVARPLRQHFQRTPRRYASDHASHGHGHGAGHGESAFHAESGPATESFGRGFYISIASIPIFYVLYSVASSPKDNVISRLIKTFETSQEEESRKNVIHTTMMEQAAADRQLFAGSPRDTTGSPMRYPEAFNVRSPWNVAAGRDSVDLSALTAHYKEQDRLQEEARVSRLKDGKVVTAYD